LNGLFTDTAFQGALRASLAVILVVGLLALAVAAWEVVEPLLVASVLATALWPWVSRISSAPLGPKRWRIPRIVATSLIYASALATSILFIWIMLTSLVPAVDRVLAAFPEQTAQARQFLEPFRAGDLATGAAKVAEDVAREATNGQAPGEGGAEGPSFSVGTLAIALFGGLTNLVLVLLFTFFLLLEGDRLAHGLLLTLPKDRRIHFRALGLQIRDQVSRWVLAQVVYASVSGLIVGTATWLLQLPTPWIYGMLGVFFGLFPGLGPATATIPAFLVALDLSYWQTVGVAALAVVVYALDSAVLVPKIYGDFMRLPMLVVLVATLVGALLMGVWGAMLASPVAVAVQILLRDLQGRSPDPNSN
jgi:predicted PurR-regulated permease PerM